MQTWLAFFLGVSVMCAGALSAEWQRSRLASPAGAGSASARARAMQERAAGGRDDDRRRPATTATGARRAGPAESKEARDRTAPDLPGAVRPASGSLAAALPSLRGRSAEGSPESGAGHRASAADGLEESGDESLVFRNTYYHVAEEGAGAKDATLFNASCAAIASVPTAFHDDVCVQGSGRLASGEVVSFAARDCACAAVCPRTGQRICFEQLDQSAFPHGRGARGTAVVPLRTVAVDSEVIPLGSTLFIPELVGLPTLDGGEHDGCFVAEDRGIQIRGHHIDIFTGTGAMMSRWNVAFPSNKGVHVVLGAARCAAHELDTRARKRRSAARR